MLVNLPWLPVPGDAERECFSRLAAAGAAFDPAAWRELLNHGWPEPALRRVGQRIRAWLAAGPAASALSGAGVAPFRLLVLAANTFAHMADAVIASALRHGVLLELEVAEYTDPASWLADPANRADGWDGVLVACDAHGWRLESAGDQDEGAALDRAAERAAAALKALVERGASSVIVQTLPDDLSEMSINLDAATPGSRGRMLHGFNERLGGIAGGDGHAVLDVARLANLVGLEAWWPGRYWFSAKLPFAMACIPIYADNLGRILAARIGKSRRVLVLDLDNTLWGGVIGDDGVEGIVLGQGSALGEAHLAMQRIARAYASRGVVLCVASKNTHDIAMEAFLRHPDMLLRDEDIAVFRINWQDKAGNISALAETLNLGLEAFVFVDDSPVERKQVRDALPLVAVPELPADPADWPITLAGAGYFEQISVTAEDRQRGRYYKTLAARSELQEKASDTTDFLKSLGTRVRISGFDSIQRKRIAQLISKSNQYNLTTRRYSEQEVERLEKDPDAVTLQTRLSDLFGDAGMISVIVARRDGAALDIDLWLMSCRVLGRRVEEAALQVLVNRARAIGVEKLVGTYIPSPRNRVVEHHYPRLGFSKTMESADGVTFWELKLADYVPADLPIEIEDADDILEKTC